MYMCQCVNMYQIPHAFSNLFEVIALLTNVTTHNCYYCIFITYMCKFYVMMREVLEAAPNDKVAIADRECLNALKEASGGTKMAPEPPKNELKEG